jgi:CRP/FNR family transcriptional regulator, cyclic AMP receptor protein
MRSPYGFEIRDECTGCTMKQKGFFCDMPAEPAKAFERVKFTSSYPEGAVLFVEGQSPRGVYMICKGQVKLTMTSSEGRTLIVRVASGGQILGLHSTLSGEPYELTAEALEPCQVNFVRREDFLRLLREQPAAFASTLQQMGDSYKSACQQIRYLGLAQNATEKLARFLLEAATRGQNTPEGIRINLKLTHEEISQVVGVSRETVTRSLSEFRSKMFISTKGASLVIRNMPALEAIVCQ